MPQSRWPTPKRRARITWEKERNGEREIESEREREQLEFECVQKDDEAAAKWLKLVSSCGLFFSPNIQMGVHIYHIYTYIWLYIYVHACIFFFTFYTRLICIACRGVENEFAHIWHIILQGCCVACGMRHVASCLRYKLLTSCCDFWRVVQIHECVCVCLLHMCWVLKPSNNVIVIVIATPRYRCRWCASSYPVSSTLSFNLSPAFTHTHTQLTHRHIP